MHTFHRTAAVLATAMALSVALTHAQERAIEQGKTFADLGGAEGQVALLRLHVPSGVESMVIEAWGGQGNLDLFVRQGKAPDGKHFDFQSASPTNTERANVPGPQEGAWYIGLYGRTTFSGASIRVTFHGGPSASEAALLPGPPVPPASSVPAPDFPAPLQTQPAPTFAGPLVSQPAAPEPAIGPPSPRMPSGPQPAMTPPPPVMIPPPPTPGASAPTPAALEAIPFLANGQRTTLAGAAGEGFSFRLAVPPGTTRLRLTLEGGHGECDLYVHYDIPPLPNRFADLVSRNGTAPSAVSEILDPAAGLWFLRVQGKTPFKDLTLSATYEPATPPAAIPSPPPSPETKPAM